MENTIGGAATSTTTPLPVASTIDPVVDLIPIYTNSAGATQAINRQTYLGISGQPVDTSSVQTLSNKTLTAPVLNSPSFTGSPTFTNAILISPILEGLVTGWVLANETWTYASATTITVPTNATLKYSVGDKLMLTQGASVLYFYVTAVTATVLTITGGSDYTLTNTTITLNYYSKASSPLGFPQWFNYAPTLSGFSSNPTPLVAKFAINGRLCTVQLSDSGNGTGNATTRSYTLPVTPANSGGGIFGGLDAGTQYFCYHIYTSGNVTVACYIGPTAGATWTASGNSRLFNAGVGYSYAI